MRRNGRLTRLRRAVGALPAPRPGHYWIAAFLLAYLLLLREIRLGRPFAFGDLSPVGGRAALSLFTETWHHRLLGYDHQFSALTAYQGAIGLLGGPLARNLAYLALIPACFASAAIFARRFLPDPAARYAAAGLYAINPVTIGEFVNGGANEFLALAGAPLALHYCWRVAETDRWRPAIAAGAVVGATAVVPWTAFWTIGPFAAALALRERDRPAVLGKLVAAGLLGVVLSLPAVYYLLQRASALGATDLLFEQLRWNYGAATVPSLLRLAGNHGSYAMATLGFNGPRPIGLVIPLVALAGASRRRLRFCLPIAGGLVATAALIHHGVLDPLFAAIPPLWSLRNPTKLLFPLTLATALLFGGGVATLLEQIAALGTGDRSPLADRGRWGGRSSTRSDSGRIPGRGAPGPLGSGGTATRRPSGRVRGPGTPATGNRTVRDGGPRRLAGLDPRQALRLAVVVLLVLPLAGYLAPAAGGTLGLEETRAAYTVPESYDRAGERIEGRVLWLPYSYSTQLRLRSAAPDHVGLRSGGLPQGKPGGDLVTELFRDVAAGERVAPRLRALGVTHVVVDRNPQRRYPATDGAPRLALRHGAPWLFGDPATFAERLATAPAYERAFAVGNLTAFRLRDASATERRRTVEGIQRVLTPSGPAVEALSENLVTNGDVDDGLDGWWYWRGDGGTRTEVVRTGGDPAIQLRTPNGSVYPIAQQVAVTERAPYRIDAAVDGRATVALYWYDGPKRPDTLVGRETFPAGALPRVVLAKGSTLSLRLRPAAGDRVVIDDVRVARTTYPAETGLPAAGEQLPGVVIPATERPEAATRSVALDARSGPGALVAVNVPRDRALAAGADAVVRDAETVLDGDLVYDRRFRQGVAVRLDGGLPERVPEGARVHATRTDDGDTVLDYWVTGTFDDSRVTVVETAYDPGWTGPPSAAHVRANGWANGFVGATPETVRWTGGDRPRRAMIAAWLLAWALTLGALAVLGLRDLRRRTGTRPGAGAL